MKDFFLKHYHALKTSEYHWLRKTIGGLLVLGGIFGFLPVLGYWMLPLGLALLASDFPFARRLHRRLTVWLERTRRRFNGGQRIKPPARQPQRTRRNS